MDWQACRCSEESLPTEHISQTCEALPRALQRFVGKVLEESGLEKSLTWSRMSHPRDAQVYQHLPWQDERCRVTTPRSMFRKPRPRSRAPDSYSKGARSWRSTPVRFPSAVRHWYCRSLRRYIPHLATTPPRKSCSYAHDRQEWRLAALARL
jgi:hypothetical protein